MPRGAPAPRPPPTRPYSLKGFNTLSRGPICLYKHTVPNYPTRGIHTPQAAEAPSHAAQITPSRMCMPLLQADS